MNLRGSLENIYGLIGDEAMHNYAGHTADHMMVRVPQNLGEEDLSVMQESARSVLRQNQLLTNMINPIANTTTDFYSEYRGGFHPGTN